MRKTEEPETKIARVKMISTPTVVKNLQTWLRECLFTIVEGDDGAVRFARVVARQLVKGNKRGEEAFSVDVPKKAGEEWCDTAALDIHSKLANETSSLGGLQKYALYAYHTGDYENHISRFVVRMQGIEDDDEGDGLNSEGPDKAGLTSQAMRHTEAANRTMVAMVQSVIGPLQSTISRLAQMNERLLDDKLNNLEAIQAMVEDRQEHEVKLIQSRAKAKGIEDLIGKLGVLLPAAANRLTGKPIFPVEDSSMMMMVRSLITSIMTDPDRAEKLMGLLSPEQGIALMNLYETISTKEEEDKRKALAVKSE